MFFKFKIWLSTFLCFLFIGGSSLCSEKNSYHFNHLGIEDGLSQSTIYSIIQDQTGYMWFATNNGLNKYNGYTFTVFTHNPLDSTTLSHNGITALFEDSEGIIWIGTIEGGLNKFDRKTGNFKRYIIDDLNDSLFVPYEQEYDYPFVFSRYNYNTITTITEDKAHNLWIGTWGKGTIKFNKHTGKVVHFFKAVHNLTGIYSNRITSILADREDNIWVGTFGGGLNRFIFDYGNSSANNYKILTYSHSNKKSGSISGNKILCLYEDSSGSIWVGTYAEGLNKLLPKFKNVSPAEAKFSSIKREYNSIKGLSNNNVMALIEDDYKNLWIGTLGGGLDKLNLNNGKIRYFQHDPFNDNSLTDNDVMSLYFDKSGILWVGTHLGAGISKVQRNDKKFNIIKHIPGNRNSLSDDVVWSIYQDSDSILWVGTFRGGLNKIDRKSNRFLYYTNDPSDPSSISDNHIRVIKEDKFKNLWIGTFSGGLNKFDPETAKFTRYKYNPDDPHSIGSNQIQDIYIESDSIFWIAAFGGGLNRFVYSNFNKNKIEFKRYQHISNDSSSIIDDRAYGITRVSSGDLWISTFGGVSVFNKKSKSFKSYTSGIDDVNSLSDNRIMAVFEDHLKNIWLGTYGGGINKFTGKSNSFIKYSESTGLPSDDIYGFMEDNNNNLWISSDNGIFKFNIINGSIISYDLRDGLQSLEFSGGAFFKSKSGEMFFGGISGLNYFYPDSIIDNSFIPPIVINSIKVFDKQIKGEAGEIELSYDQNFFSIEFSALDFTNPSENNYAYILENLDPDWRYTNAFNRVVNYTYLKPGEYIFKVKGTNSDGVWNENVSSLKIMILPPFWQTWWFISLAAVAGVLFFYFLFTIRYRNLLAIEKLKTKLAADLHDNVGSGLTEIAILSELTAKEVKTHFANAEQKLRKISDKARLLVDNMSDIVWMVNPKHDSLYDLIVHLKDSYREFLSSVGISFKTSNLEKLSGVKLSMDYRQNLYLILKEGINNSIKHSKCTKIFLEANVRGDEIKMTLKDNGKGIGNDNIKFGNGVKNIENRADQIGAKVRWISDPGKGTSIYFTCKIGGFKNLKSIFNI